MGDNHYVYTQQYLEPPMNHVQSAKPTRAPDLSIYTDLVLTNQPSFLVLIVKYNLHRLAYTIDARILCCYQHFTVESCLP